MKKNLLLFLLFISTHVFAQTIQSITILPPNPVETDSVFILAHCSFSSGPCTRNSGGFSINGDTINAWALHCLGMLTVICNYTDTFSVGTLSAGNYTFNFHLDEGYGELTCTPGIVAGPDSSFSFTVLPNTSGIENTIEKNAFTIYPNPASENLMIRFIHNLKSYRYSVTLINIYGTKIFGETITPVGNEIPVDLKNYAPGIYFLKLSTENSNSLVKIIKQ